MRRRRQLAKALSLASVCVVRRCLRAGPGRQSALRDRLGRGSSGGADDHQTADRPAADRGAEKRLVLAGLHVASVQRRGSAAIAGRHAGLRQFRRRSRSDQRRHRNRERRRGPGEAAADARGCRAAGDDHRIGSAVVGAAARVAVPRRRRRAQQAPDRCGRPPWHRDVGRAGVPRYVRPPGDARPGAVPDRRRPRRQPGRHHADRHHQLHRHHRAGRFGLRQLARGRGHRTAAQHVGRGQRSRCSASATAPRSRWPTPGHTPTRWRGCCSTPRCRWRSPPRLRWSNA